MTVMPLARSPFAFLSLWDEVLCYLEENHYHCDIVVDDGDCIVFSIFFLCKIKKYLKNGIDLFPPPVSVSLCHMNFHAVEVDIELLIPNFLSFSIPIAQPEAH